MKSLPFVAIALTLLCLTTPAYALREVVVGNQPLRPGRFRPEILAAVNTEERVYLYVHDGNPFFFFKGGPRSLNEAIRRFAAIPADKREIILLPAPAKPLIHDKKAIAYDWCLHVPMGNRRFLGDTELSDTRATLTIYICEPLPPPLPDPQKARKWIGDLDSDDFKVRDRATKDLRDLGPPVASLLREALKSQISAEGRNRMQRILADLVASSGALRLDLLELPDSVPVIGLEALLSRCRKELANKDASIRGRAAMFLVDYGAPANDILPDLEKILKDEKHSSPLAGAARAASSLGASAQPLLPFLRATAKTADKSLASICQQAIDTIEKAEAEPVNDAEAKRRATIRNETREFVAGREKNAGK